MKLNNRLPYIVAHLHYVLAILQRVLSASVTVDKQLVSSIGKGVLVFAAIAPGDTEKEVDAMATKVLKMKLWEDECGGTVWKRCLFQSESTFVLTIDQWKRNVQDIEGEILCGQ